MAKNAGRKVKRRIAKANGNGPAPESAFALPGIPFVPIPYIPIPGGRIQFLTGSIGTVKWTSVEHEGEFTITVTKVQLIPDADSKVEEATPAPTATPIKVNSGGGIVTAGSPITLEKVTGTEFDFRGAADGLEGFDPTHLRITARFFDDREEDRLQSP